MGDQLGGAVITGLVVIATAWMTVFRGTEQKRRCGVLMVLIVGLLAGLPVAGIMLVLTQVAPEGLGPLQTALYGGFVSSALPAELVKLIVLGLYFGGGRRGKRRREIGPVEGARAGAAVALGFAAIESAFYLALEGGWATALLRAVPGVLIQTAAGVIIGQAMGLRRAASTDTFSVSRAWIQAALLHGGYGFTVLGMIEISYLQLVSRNNLTPLLATLFALLIVITAISATRLVRIFRVVAE